MSAPPVTSPVITTLVDTAHISVLAAALLLMGMSTAAFTKAGKGKKAGAKVGFALTGLFLLAGTGLLVTVAVQIILKKEGEKKE